MCPGDQPGTYLEEGRVLGSFRGDAAKGAKESTCVQSMFASGIRSPHQVER